LRTGGAVGDAGGFGKMDVDDVATQPVQRTSLNSSTRMRHERVASTITRIRIDDSFIHMLSHSTSCWRGENRCSACLALIGSGGPPFFSSHQPLAASPSHELPRHAGIARAIAVLGLPSKMICVRPAPAGLTV